MASTYLQRTPSSGSTTTITYSCWLKRSDPTTLFDLFSGGDTGINNNMRVIQVDTTYVLVGYYNAGFTFKLQTYDILRDTSGWYHLCVAIDTTQATASDRVKLWINGRQITSFETADYPSQNFNLNINNPSYDQWINNLGGRSIIGQALLAHCHYIDGTTYDADTFGEYDANGVWKPKTDVSVTYGTNGFFLKFENSGSMGTDSSGNANNFTVNGTLTQTLDTPSNVYATWNPLDYRSVAIALSYGNTYMNGTNDPSYPNAQTTLAIPKKGKWYAEFKQEGTQGFAVGIADVEKFTEALRSNTDTYVTSYDGLVALLRDGSVMRNGTQTYSVTSSFSSYDIAMIAYDADNGAMYFGRNGTWGTVGGVTSDPTSGASKTGAIDISGQTWWTNSDFQTFSVGSTSSGEYARISANFGNGYFLSTAVSSAGSNGNGSIFEYDVPTGYYALNTKNLATYG